MNRPNNRHGFSKIELLAVLFVVVLLVAVLLATIQRAAARSQRIHCTNNLKQLGLTCRTRALQHNEESPPSLPEAGTLAVNSSGEIEVFRYVQLLSNQRADSKLLICPADTRQAATNPVFISNENLSYFLGLDAKDTTPQMFLFGDRNLTNGPLPLNHLLLTRTNFPIGWGEGLHGNQGNIGLADGSVQQFSSARLRKSVIPPQRLAFP